METKPFSPNFNQPAGRPAGAPVPPPAPGFNPQPKKKNSSNAATVAASAVAGGVAGFAASQFAAAAQESEIELEGEPIVDEDIITEDPVDNNTGGGHTGGYQTPQQPQQPQSQPQQPQVQPQTPPQPADDIVVTPDEPVTPLDPVNPDEIADAIIAEDMIDPSDIDADDYFDFSDIGTVTTIEGDEMTVATFETGDGDMYAMVDVNNDGIMDFIVDSDGNTISQDCAGYTTDDIIDRLTPGDTYIAATDDYDPTLDSQMQDDMIS